MSKPLIILIIIIVLGLAGFAWFRSQLGRADATAAGLQLQGQSIMRQHIDEPGARFESIKATVAGDDGRLTGTYNGRPFALQARHDGRQWQTVRVEY